MEMEESEVSHVFPNEEFGYWKVSILVPQRDASGNVVRDKKLNPVPDKTKSFTVTVPFTYPDSIGGYLKNEVLPYMPDVWIDAKKTQIGYEISFLKYFYKPVALRKKEEILTDLLRIDEETDGLLKDLITEGN